MNKAPVILTIEGAVVASGIGRSRLYEHIAAGKLHPLRAGGRTLLLAKEVTALRRQKRLQERFAVARAA